MAYVSIHDSNSVFGTPMWWRSRYGGKNAARKRKASWNCRAKHFGGSPRRRGHGRSVEGRVTQAHCSVCRRSDRLDNANKRGIIRGWHGLFVSKVIQSYDNLLNSLADNEAVLFADAVHPTHAARAAGCCAPSQEKLAIEQTSGRQRINIHGAINLETGQTRMIEALTIDAASTIRLLQSIEALYPMLALIHVFLDNARYHHARLVQEWLAQPGRRIKLHFIPTYCPHLNPIEQLWGVMHKHVTHNKCYATCAQFADATLGFLREKVPRNWAELCDSVTDNFRIINPKDFRVMT